MWLCILVLVGGLAVSNYRGAKAKREQFVAWRTAQSDISQLKHSIGMFKSDSSESYSWEQFTNWLAGTLPVVNDLEALPGGEGWMQSGAMYVDTRSLFLRFHENSPAEEVVVAFVVIGQGGTEFIVLTDDGRQYRTGGREWIADQNDLRSRRGLARLPPLIDD